MADSGSQRTGALTVPCPACNGFGTPDDDDESVACRLCGADGVASAAVVALLRRLTDRYPSPINRFTEDVDQAALVRLVDSRLATFDGALVYATTAGVETLP